MAKVIVFLTFVTFVAPGPLASEAWAGRKVNKPSSLSQHAVKGGTLYGSYNDPQEGGRWA